MKVYQAYGLSIKSPIPLSHLPSMNSGECDVKVKKGKVEVPRTKNEKEDNTFGIHGEGVFFNSRKIALFLIKSEKEIIFDPYPNVDPQLLRLSLLGPAMAIVLSLRGYLVLHASAVRVGEGVVAFVGPKGAGKSTTAAALSRNGCDIVTDDMLVVDFTGGAPPLAVMGPALMKIREDALGYLGDLQSKEVKIKEKMFKKRVFKFRRSKPYSKKPIKRIYFLKKSYKSGIIDIEKRESLIRIMSNLYNRKIVGIINGELERRKFERCIDLNNTVVSRILNRKMEGYTEVSKIIENDIQNDEL